MTVEARVAAADIPRLESRLAANPQSPVFARLASCYVAVGEIQRAVELSVEGLKRFPEYATAHLVLGQCYEALGRNVEAMLEYRAALKTVPDNPTLRALVANTEQREQDAFKAFAEERARKLAARKNTATIEEFVAAASPAKESTVDFLLRRLQDAKTAPRREPQPDESHADRSAQGTAKIVTATLAEIYADQGEYQEAIDAYRTLLARRPSEAERYERRISQLEELLRLHQGER